jgi:hypothetical protein
LSASAFFRVFQDTGVTGATPNVIDCVLARGLFQVLIEGTEQTGGTLDDTCLLIIQVCIGDLRGRQLDSDFPGGDFDVIRLQATEVDSGFYDAMSNHEDAAFAEAGDPFDVIEDNDFFHDVLDGDELGQGFDLLDDHGCVVGRGGVEAGEPMKDNSNNEAEAENEAEEQGENGQALFEHESMVAGGLGLQKSEVVRQRREGNERF